MYEKRLHAFCGSPCLIKNNYLFFISYQESVFSSIFSFNQSIGCQGRFLPQFLKNS